MSEPKTKTVINTTSGTTFHTTKGELLPLGSHELPTKEADFMLEYRGIVDAAQYVAPGAAGREIVELKAHVKELEKKLEESASGESDKKLDGVKTLVEAIDLEANKPELLAAVKDLRKELGIKDKAPE